MQSLSPLSASDLQLFLANPEQLLQQSMELQLAVASFIDTPCNLLEVLVNSPLQVADKPNWKDSNLRYFLLTQENTPTWVLAELADVDIEELTSEKLAEEQQRGSTPGIHKTWIRETLQFLVDAAKHPQVSAEILQKISQYPSPEIKLAITQNSNAPEALKLELLEELAIHNDYQIRKKLAEDTNTPTSILKLMVNHESYENKLRREIRRVFTSEYPENSHSYEGTADKLLSDLKYEVLYPANVTINIEQWIELITNSEIWEIMMDDTTLTDSFWSGVPSIR